MRNWKLPTALLAMAICGMTLSAAAQDADPESKPGGFFRSIRNLPVVEELDELGHNLLGSPKVDDDRANKRSTLLQPKKRNTNQWSSTPEAPPYAPPAGSSTTAPGTRSASSLSGSAGSDPPVYRSPYYTSPGARAPAITTPGRSVAGPPATVRRDASLSGPAADVPDEPEVATPSWVKGGSSAAAQASATPDSPMLRPLHERLQAFRQSAFANQGSQSPLGEAPGSERPSLAGSGILPPSDPPLTDVEKPATPAVPTPATRPRPATDLFRSTEPAPAGRPTIAERRAPAARTDIAPAATTDTLPTARTDSIPAARTDAVSKVPTTPATPTTSVIAGRRSSGNSIATPRVQDGVLIARKGPVLSVETFGPRRIQVGRESIYEVRIVNSGEVAAEEVVVFVNLPAWADVAGAEASAGATQPAAGGEVARPMQWKVGQMPAGSKEKLILRIVPRESRPFDLAVRWDCKPVASQTMIEVQEPKLSMHLEGPREVLYGKKELFTLRLSNVGNGDAEKVVITLLPVGTGENQPASHKLGVLAAGEEKTIEIELTARQAGQLLIQMDVRGDGGIHAELAEKVLVRRAALQVDVEGPQVQYVGAVSTYRIRVQNPGTAPAKNVRLSMTIPPGGKYLSGINGARLEANGTKVQWTVEGLNPGIERTFTARCQLGLPGATRVETLAAADDDLSATAAAMTRVEAMADLVMDVKDPATPVPVGDEAIYELRIRNRGTKNAENVEVLAYFVRGVEPVAAEGGPHKLAAGQVAFDPVASLAAGSELVLKVRAKAETFGNHVFRAEVHCKPLGTRLVSERTTHFYQDGSGPQQASRTAVDGESLPQASRASDRRVPGPAPLQAESTPPSTQTDAGPPPTGGDPDRMVPTPATPRNEPTPAKPRNTPTPSIRR